MCVVSMCVQYPCVQYPCVRAVSAQTGNLRFIIGFRIRGAVATPLDLFPFLGQKVRGWRVAADGATLDVIICSYNHNS